jgi:hypothetical protein
MTFRTIIRVSFVAFHHQNAEDAGRLAASSARWTRHRSVRSGNLAGDPARLRYPSVAGVTERQNGYIGA